MKKFLPIGALLPDGLMNIGMSLACFYPKVPEDVISVAQEIGIKQCEIFINTFCEIEPDYLYAIRQRCDDAGIEVYSVHPFTSGMENYLFFMPYQRRIDDAKRLYRRYADAAGILGAKVVNIHGDRGLALENYEKYRACLLPLIELQRETGIYYAFENVYYNSVNHPEVISRLRQDLPDIRFTFDIKQAHKGGQNPYDVLEAMGSSIINFHINDFDDEHVCLLPGEGKTDYRRIFSALRSYSYDGPALIEVYKSNFEDINQMKRAKNYLEQNFCLQNDEG